MKKKILFVHVDKSMEVCGQKKEREDEYQCIHKYWKLNADKAQERDNEDICLVPPKKVNFCKHVVNLVSHYFFMQLHLNIITHGKTH